MRCKGVTSLVATISILSLSKDNKIETLDHQVVKPNLCLAFDSPLCVTGFFDLISSEAKPA